MAVLFSAVTITSDSDQAEFLVAGIPKGYADLEGWTAFESFMNGVVGRRTNHRPLRLMV